MKNSKNGTFLSIMIFVIWAASGINFWAFANNEYVIALLSFIGAFAGCKIISIYFDFQEEPVRIKSTDEDGFDQFCN